MSEKGGFVKPSREEIAKIKAQKLSSDYQERLQRQETYREAVLVRIAKQIRLNDFAKKLREQVDANKEGEFTIFATTFTSLNHARSEFQLEEFYYLKSVRNEEYYKKALENDGLTSEQIESIAIDGKLIKKYVDLKDEKIEYTG